MVCHRKVRKELFRRYLPNGSIVVAAVKSADVLRGGRERKANV